MNWYEIEIEVFLFGKDFNLVKASQKDEAITIAKRNASKKFSCPEEYVEILSCKQK